MQRCVGNTFGYSSVDPRLKDLRLNWHAARDATKIVNSKKQDDFEVIFIKVDPATWVAIRMF